MAALSIGAHFSPSCRFKKRSSHAPSVYSLPSFGTSLCRIRGPRLLRNGVLPRAEDKARDSSSPTQPQLQQPNNEKEIKELSSQSGTCDPLCSVDETSSQDFEAAYQPKTDLLKTIAVFTAALTGTLAINLSWVADNQDIAMALLFVIGYAGIIFEESLAFNKSGVGLLMAVSLWVVRGFGVRMILRYLILDCVSLLWPSIRIKKCKILLCVHTSFKYCVVFPPVSPMFYGEPHGRDKDSRVNEIQDL